MASSSRTEAVARLGELVLIDGGQYLVDGLLHQTVYYCRYSQQAHLAIVPLGTEKLLLTETIYSREDEKYSSRPDTCLRVALLLQAWLSIPPKILPIRSHFRRKLHLFDFSRRKARQFANA